MTNKREIIHLEYFSYIDKMFFTVFIFKVIYFIHFLIVTIFKIDCFIHFS